MTVNGLDIYYTSKNIRRGLKLISKKTASGLKPIKGASCKKLGSGLKILQ